MLTGGSVNKMQLRGVRSAIQPAQQNKTYREVGRQYYNEAPYCKEEEQLSTCKQVEVLYVPLLQFWVFNDKAVI